MSHAANPDLLNRLRRANGHLAGIIKMVEDGGDGLKIAQQMQAVVSALEKTKTLIVTDHIEHHLEDLIGPCRLFVISPALAIGHVDLDGRPEGATGLAQSADCLAHLHRPFVGLCGDALIKFLDRQPGHRIRCRSFCGFDALSLRTRYGVGRCDRRFRHGDKRQGKQMKHSRAP
jgi:DNA-binding FrmR family transcriptional regulator